MNVLTNLAVRDVETLVHPYTNLAAFRDTGPLVIERAKGVYVYDTEGKDYIEGMAGLWCTALGYGNEELVETAAAQMRKLSFAHLFSGRSHDPAIELAEKLKEIAPVPISKVFFCNSGSEANDSQMKMVWYMEQRPRPARARKKIVSRQRAYHTASPSRRRPSPDCRPTTSTSTCRSPASSTPPARTTIATLCTGRRKRRGLRDPPRRRARSLILREDPDTVAAFIAEPVMGAGGGVIVPAATYFEKIAPRCATNTTS